MDRIWRQVQSLSNGESFTQIEGIEYEDTFSPAVRFAPIRLFLALVVHLDLDLFQMYVKIAFRNVNPEEKIYMD